MAIKAAARGAIPPFMVMEVMRAAGEREAAGGEVLHLEVGQPSTSAPSGAIAMAKAALDADVLGYTEAFGLRELRAAISAHYKTFYGLDVPLERIIVTTGASGAFVLGYLAAFDPGDRIALALPGYPGYRHIATAVGLEPVPIEAGPETRFQPSVALLDAIEGPIDGLVVASPSNPAGTMLSPDDLAELAA